MQTIDYIKLMLGAVSAKPLRTMLTVICIAIGIATVVLLTSIGEGIRHYVLAEFTQFGTTLVGINPGRITTVGASIGVFGTDNPLTIEDAQALKSLNSVTAVTTIVQGNAEIEYENKSRRTTIYGVEAAFPVVFSLRLAAGDFLPADDPLSPRAYAVLGSKLKQALFGDAGALGQRVRVAGHRYRVIGTMQSKGQVLGFDLDDTLYIPTQRALSLFNRDGVMEIDVLYKENRNESLVVADIERVLRAKHGQVDFTITTQQQMLDVLGTILQALTMTVGALGGISLLVGGIGILTITTLAVRERIPEIGLLRALGATRRQILFLFLGEAVVMAVAGGLLGLALGLLCAGILTLTLQALPVHVSLLYSVLALFIALGTGLFSGVYPALRAAALHPITALRAE
jgi:putative ABC transport system permease protein